jgi:hypothetical protein
MNINSIKQAIKLLEENRQSHYYCEDTWYSCPKHEEGCANDSEIDDCTCGADFNNGNLDAVISLLHQVIEKEKNT